jgi:hypothetical protein
MTDFDFRSFLKYYFWSSKAHDKVCGSNPNNTYLTEIYYLPFLQFSCKTGCGLRGLPLHNFEIRLVFFWSDIVLDGGHNFPSLSAFVFFLQRALNSLFYYQVIFKRFLFLFPLNSWGNIRPLLILKMFVVLLEAWKYFLKYSVFKPWHTYLSTFYTEG